MMNIRTLPWRLRMGRAAILVACTLLLTSTRAAADPADPLVVETAITIPVDDGKGAGTFFLIVPADVEKLPPIDFTAAVAPGGATIPSTDIHPDIPKFEKSDKPRVFPITIRVDTKTPVEPTATYTGKIIVFTTERKEVTFSVTRSVNGTFEVDPKSFNTALSAFDDGKRSIRIRNTSAAPLRHVDIASLGFANEQGRTVVMPTAKNKQLSDRNSTIDVTLPWPSCAGTYTGAIDVIGPTGEQKSIAVTYAVRGPWGRYGWPLVFLVLTVIVGCLASEGLERLWSERKIEELEVERTLRIAASEIGRVFPVLTRWTSAKVPLSGTETAFAASAERIDKDLETLRILTTEQLAAAAARAQNDARSARIFVAEVGSLTPKQTTATAIDAIPIDSQTYRTDLRRAIATPGRDAEASIPTENVPRRDPDDIAKQLKRIRIIRWVLLLVVVLLFAYQTFYQGERDFGTAGDYLKVLLWALGLTQAGSQIITRARSLPT